MIGRIVRIVSAATALTWLFLTERWRGVSRSQSALPEQMRRTLDRLGPTFIKVGQALSMRPDLFSEQYLVALRELREHAQTFPAPLARAEAEQAIGRDIDQVFSVFEAEPFAAASIAQVHRAVLRDGQEVIVKIRRPGIRQRIDSDMRILVLTTRIVSILIPSLRRLQLQRIATEIWTNLNRETDLLSEAHNIRRFAKIYRHRQDIYIPNAIEPLCSEAVLVQAMSHGRSIEDESLRPVGPHLAEVLVDFYLEQLLKTGLFHGDPHSGNLFVMDDKVICFHDFGLVGYLDRITRQNLGAFLQAFVYQDANWMLDSSIELGLIARPDDRGVFVRGIEEILDDYSSLPIRDWSIAEAFLRVMRLGDGSHVTVPYNLVVFMRTLFLIEGTLRKLDPNLNVLETLIAKGQSALAEMATVHPPAGAMARLKTEFALTGQDLPLLVATWLHRAHQQGGAPTLRLEINQLDADQRRLARSADRIALAIVSLGLLVASSVLMHDSVGPRMYGIPMLAFAGYALALWLLWRLLRSMATSARS